MPTQNAMMIPKTRDGRVLFIVPWLGHLILGTTDTPVDTFDREPQADKADIDFILSEAAHYLNRAPTRADILSTWAGLRPLVQDTSAGSTKAISREHTIEIAANRLLTVTGGKWTTYRSMAADVMTHALDAGLLSKGTPQLCVTENLRLLGADSPCNQTDLAAAGEFEFVRFAAQHEFARCTEDVLARRSRALFLNAQKTAALSASVTAHMHTLGFTQLKVDDLGDMTAQYSQCP
jgi:glycerol-3-phosphate dehydrogenase